MTPEILQWLDQIAKPYLLPSAGRVLEVGALNVNGSPRTVIQSIAIEYIGTDMQAGSGVDRVINNAALRNCFGNRSFDTVVCCECLEHDGFFWNTVDQMQDMVKSGGYLIITTPHFNFPEHKYPRHYVNFGRDAYEDWFFAGMNILDLRLLNSSSGLNTTVAGIARKS